VTSDTTLSLSVMCDRFVVLNKLVWCQTVIHVHVQTPLKPSIKKTTDLSQSVVKTETSSLFNWLCLFCIHVDVHCMIVLPIKNLNKINEINHELFFISW
jgi:hypothetical protein